MRKKIISLVLVTVFLFSMISGAITVSAEENLFVYNVDKSRDKIAISRGASYSYSYSGTAMHGTYTDSGTELTDGSVAANGEVGSDAVCGFVGAGTVTILVDLGSDIRGITDFYVHAHQKTSWGITLPSEISFSVSIDGTYYKKVGTASNIPASPTDETAYSLGESYQYGVGARFVKFEISYSKPHVFIDEIAIYTYGDFETLDSALTDEQLITYSVNDSTKTAFVSSYNDSKTITVTETVYGQGITPSSASGLTNNTTYTVGSGSDAETSVKVTFISSGNGNRPGRIVNNKDRVVVHNTGNYASGATALANFNYVRSSSAGSAQASWHYTVGSDGIYQSLPDNENAWHASDGSTGSYNYYGIGMEVAVNGFPGHYGSSTWKTNYINYTIPKAAIMIAELLVRHDLACVDGDTITQHWDSNGKNCPEQMRYTTSSGSYTRYNGDLWKLLIAATQKYYKLLTEGGTYEKTTTKVINNTVSNVVVPQYVMSSGKLYKVTGLSGSSFKSKSVVKSVHIPATITWMSDGAFTGSSNLANITVSASNTNFKSQNGKLYSLDSTLICSPDANTNSATTIRADAVTLRSGCIDAFDLSNQVVLKAVEFNYMDRSLVDPDTSFTVSWTKIDDADSYDFKAIIIAGEPNPTNSSESTEPGAETIQYETSSQATSVTIPASYVKAGKWIKISTSANYNEYNVTKWATIYIKVRNVKGQSELILSEQGKVYIDGLNIAANYTDGKILYTSAYTSAITSVYWHVVTATYDSTSGGYIVNAVYAVGTQKSVTTPANGLMLAVHDGELNQAACAKITVGSIIRPSTDINLATGTFTANSSFVTVYNMVENTPTTDEGWKVKQGSTVVIDENGKRASNCKERTSADSLIAMFDSTVKVFLPSGTEIMGNANVGTGYLIKLFDSQGKVIDTVNVIIKGDCDGNGAIEVADYLMVKRNFQKLYTLSGLYSDAADIDGSGVIDSTDYLKLRRYFSKLLDIYN